MIKMDPEQINKKDKSMKEIKTTLEDIENFRKGNYREIASKKGINKEKLKELTEKTGASKITITETLGEDLLKEKEE